MTRPLRVRVSFELSESEAEALMRHAEKQERREDRRPRWRCEWPSFAVFCATKRGLARYRARTKVEVGDG